SDIRVPLTCSVFWALLRSPASSLSGLPVRGRVVPGLDGDLVDDRLHGEGGGVEAVVDVVRLDEACELLQLAGHGVDGAPGRAGQERAGAAVAVVQADLGGLSDGVAG